MPILFSGCGCFVKRHCAYSFYGSVHYRNVIIIVVFVVVIIVIIVVVAGIGTITITSTVV